MFVVRGDVGHAAVGVPRGGAHLELECSELQPAPIFDQHVCALGARARANDRLASHALTQEPRTCDVIGMGVGVYGVHEFQTEFLEQLEVALELVDDRVDQYRLAGCLVGDEVGVSPGLVIEELPK